MLLSSLLLLPLAVVPGILYCYALAMHQLNLTLTQLHRVMYNTDKTIIITSTERATRCNATEQKLHYQLELFPFNILHCNNSSRRAVFFF